MPHLVLPVVVAVASLALTWLVCLRPMRRGSCHLPARPAGAAAPPVDELELARTELELLRLQQTARPAEQAASSSR